MLDDGSPSHFAIESLIDSGYTTRNCMTEGMTLIGLFSWAAEVIVQSKVGNNMNDSLISQIARETRTYTGKFDPGMVTSQLSCIRL